MRMRREGGFTLVEISAILLILGILYLAFSTGYNIYFKKADMDVVDVDMKTVKTMVVNYYIENSYLPDTPPQLMKATGTKVEFLLEKDGVKKFVTSGKRDPWKNPYYMYVFAGDETSPSYFAFVSTGPDGVLSDNIENVGDDIVYLYFPVK